MQLSKYILMYTYGIKLILTLVGKYLHGYQEIKKNLKKKKV